MNNKNFTFIIGTRAQLIKVAPIIVECEKQNLPCTLLMTGQHLETMQDMLDEFHIQSPQVFGLKAQERSTIFSLLSWLPMALFGILRELKKLPNEQYVLVHGDTLSTVLGAVAGRMARAKVVHIESGLTSNKIFDPFPEEIARRIVFRLCHIAMCPNSETLEHMQRKHPKKISVNTFGNTIIDSIKLSGVQRQVNAEKPYLVASLHRFQNIYDPERFRYLVKLLQDISQYYLVYFVLHPATKKRLIKEKLMNELESTNNLTLLPRLGYKEFITLAAESKCVLTDGGSNQEELAFLGVPTIVMRDATERNDGLGKNAVMEGNLPRPIVDYIKNSDFENLNLQCEAKYASPSSYIVNYLVSEK